MTESDRVEVEQMVSQRVKEALDAFLLASKDNAPVNARDVAFALPAAMRVNASRVEQGAGPDSDVANTQVGEQGRRTSDTWRWYRSTATNIMLGNVFIGYDGKMAEYASASALTIGTTATYVYAIVTWQKTDGEITGISSVSFATTTSWDTARNPVLDEDNKQTAIHVPVGKFKYATGTWGSTIVCQNRYLDGALMIGAKTTASDAPAQLWDGRFNELGNLEVYCGGMTSPAIVESVVATQAYGAARINPPASGWVDVGGSAGNVWFIIDDTGPRLELTSSIPSYTSGETGVCVGVAIDGVYQKLFYGAYCRPIKAGDETNTALKWSSEYEEWVPAPPETTNPLPDGDETSVALKWDNTSSTWVKAIPVESDNTSSTEADRCVTAISTSATAGTLLSYTTQPINALKASDFEEIEVYVPGAEWDGEGIRFKKRTLKVLKTTAAASDSDYIAFVAYPD